MSRKRELVLVGDGAVGKSWIVNCYTNGAYLKDKFPDNLKHGEFELTLDGLTHQINLKVAPGQDDFDKLRQIIYMHVNCFILCYAVDQPSSFQSISRKWMPEIKSANQKVPIVLVATKIDLRSGNGKYISTRDGEKLRRKINANAFIECSAKTDTNVREIIYEAVKASMAGIPPMENSVKAFFGF